MTDGAHPQPQIWWQTIDFRPAPPGWRVVSLFGERRDVLPMPGWLIQERYALTDDDRVILEPDEGIRRRDRRVAPGVSVDGYGWCVQPADENSPGVFDNTWKVLAPGEPEPSDEEQAAEVQRRAEAAARREAEGNTSN